MKILTIAAGIILFFQVESEIIKADSSQKSSSSYGSGSKAVTGSSSEPRTGDPVKLSLGSLYGSQFNQGPSVDDFIAGGFSLNYMSQQLGIPIG